METIWTRLIFEPSRLIFVRGARSSQPLGRCRRHLLEAHSSFEYEPDLLQVIVDGDADDACCAVVSESSCRRYARTVVVSAVQLSRLS